MTAKNTIAAIIPAHNAEVLVAQAVDSARRQKRPPDEIIVVADSCQDSTALCASDAGANVIEVDARSVAVARNAGARAARSTWCAFLDADDLWRPSWLSAVEQALGRAPKADLFYGTVREVDEQGRSISGSEPVVPDGDVYQKLLVRSFVATSAVVLRRETLWEHGGFDESFGHAGVEDFDLWLRLSQHILFEPVYGQHVIYRRFPTSAMRTPQRYAVLRDQALDIIQRATAKRPVSQHLLNQSRAFIHRLSAERFLHQGFVAEARRDLREALAADPKQIQLWAMAALSVLPPQQRSILLHQRRQIRTTVAKLLGFSFAQDSLDN